jgi:hypothetical protein
VEGSVHFTKGKYGSTLGCEPIGWDGKQLADTSEQFEKEIELDRVISCK